MQIVEQLAENPRISYREISRKTGLKYMLIRKKIQSAQSKKLLSFGLFISTDIVGREIAAVKFRFRNKNSTNSDRLITKLSNCNRVSMTFKIDNGEVFAIFHGKNKEEIIGIIEAFRSIIEDLEEVSIEYGSFSAKSMIPVKNKDVLNCNPTKYCEECIKNEI